MHSSMYVNATAIRLLGLQQEFYILYYVEIGITFVSCIGAGIAFYLLHTVRAFHNNLTVLFSNLIVVYLVSVLARFVIIAYQFEWLHEEASPLEYGVLLGCSLIRHHLMGTGTTTFVFIAVERWLATLLVADYERRRRPWIAVLLLFLVHLASWLYSIFFSFELLSGTACVFGLMVISVLGLFAFVLIHSSNVKHLRRLKEVGVHTRADHYSLSLRYQLNENIAMLFAMCIVGTVGTLVIACLFLVPFLFLSTTTAVGNLLHALVDYVVVVYTCLLVGTPAAINEIYRRAMFQLFASLCCWTRSDCGRRLLSLTLAPQLAQQLSPQQETDYYFNRLQSVWNKVPA